MYALREEPFEFWIPLSKAGVDAEGKRWIEGIASDGGEDLQGERVVQDGLDVEYFRRHGFFNWDHQDVVAVKGQDGRDRLAIGKIGEPTLARVTPEGLFVKGFLYRGNPLADAAWDLACSLESSGATRRLGFSIQGKTVRRQGNRIEKAWIQDVAITPAPVNPRTYLDVVKGLGTTTDDFGKALSTGHDKGGSGDEGDGAALRPESLDRCGRCQCDCHRDEDDELDKGARAFVADLERELRGQTTLLTRDQAVRFIQLEKGYSRETARRAAELLFEAARMGRAAIR